MNRALLVTVVAVLFVSSCAHVISQDILQEVDTEITFAELQRAPEAYQGKVVLLGGVIVKMVNKREGSLLEIYQTELDRRGRPVNIDVSKGRFFALYAGLLDSEIYRRGRKVTIVGVVQGKEVIRLGEIDYPCPYFIVKEIHLWEEERPRAYAPYPWWWYPCYYGPWFCTYPRVYCCYPWWGPRRYPLIYYCDPDAPPAIKSGLFRRWLKERQVRVEKQRVQPRRAPRISRNSPRFKGKVGLGLNSKRESLRRR